MSEKIFLVADDGSLQAMTEQPYAKELHLQEFLARYVDLLPGEQVNAQSPRRWLLVKKEISVSDSAEANGRWSLDHLFLDQDGIPTLIETKRSSDTRLRREVVGQMLEYAANAVVYWPVEKLRADFRATCESRQEDADTVLRTFVGADYQADAEQSVIDSFWERVKTNLEAEKIRLILVADEVPAETRRIIEFLNGQMERAEILAVEIKQFVGSNGTALVPRVLGQTTKAVQRKTGRVAESREWDEGLVLAEIQKSKDGGETAVAMAADLIAWAKSRASRVYCSGGKDRGAFVAEVDHGEQPVKIFDIGWDGKLNYGLANLGKTVPFSSPATVAELLGRLNRIPGLNFSAEHMARFPRLPLTLLADPASLRQFKDTYDWIIGKLRNDRAA